jgi:hypothetical protein
LDGKQRAVRDALVMGGTRFAFFIGIRRLLNQLLEFTRFKRLRVQ